MMENSGVHTVQFSHTEGNWLVPLRVIKIIKITKADFLGVPDWETRQFLA